VLLTERLGGSRGDGGGDPAFGVGVGEHAGGCLFGGDLGLVAAAGAGQAGGEFFHGGQASFDAPSPGGGVVDGLGRRVDPDDAEPAVGGHRRFEGAPDLGGVTETATGTAGGLDPVGGVVLDPLGEAGHLTPVGGQDGDEAAAVGVDVAHGLG
jgi:hypothetical protein